MKPLFFSLYSLISLLVAVRCAYEWDYTYPEIDLRTGWPIYQVQERDTLSSIAQLKFGSAAFWVLLKNRNKMLGKEIKEDTVLNTPFKMVIPPKEDCIHFMDEFCFAEEEKSLNYNDGGMQDNPSHGNKRFLEVISNDTILQTEILRSNKRSHTLTNHLINSSKSQVNIILDNNSSKSFLNWEISGPPFAQIEDIVNQPFKLAPGHQDHLDFIMNFGADYSDDYHAVLIQSQIENAPSSYLKIYIGESPIVKPWYYNARLPPSFISITISNTPEFRDEELNAGIVGPTSWNNWTSPDGTLSFDYWVSLKAPLWSMIVIRDLKNLFAGDNFWKIGSGNQILTLNSSEWQINLFDSLTQHYTIIQDNKYLGRIYPNNSVILTRSISNPPSEMETFKIVQCSDNPNQYEITQSQYILDYNSGKGKWIFEEKISSSASCVKPLSITVYT